MQRLAFLSLTLFSVVSAWIPATTSTLTTRHCDVAGSTVRLQAVEQQQQQPSRLRFLQTVAAAAVTAVSVRQPIQPSWAAATETVVTLPNGVQYEVVKSGGSGIKPDVGELVAIRFAAYNGDVKIDDIFDTPEPYYTRLGSGGLLKGVEETLPLMQLGDRWRLTIPVSKRGTTRETQKHAKSTLALFCPIKH